MDFSVEIYKIIEGALKHDDDKVINYTKLMIDNLIKCNNIRQAKMLEKVISNSTFKKNQIITNNIINIPLDKESRLPIADVFYPNQLIDEDLKLIPIPKSSDIFHYLTRIQDEVHRYTITYHKTLRDKGSISSILDNIDGIGKVRKKALIKKYGSLKKIKEASIEELKEILPENISMNLLNYLKNDDESIKQKKP